MSEAAASQDTQIAVIKRNVTAMEKMVDEYQITTDQELADVATKISSIKKFKTQVQDYKKQFTAPAREIISNANEMFDPIIGRCDELRSTLDQRAIAYHTQKEKERKEAEAKLAAKVEAGRMKPETAVKKMEALETPEKTIRTDQGSSLSFTKRKVATIEKPELIPDEYWIIDEARVKRDALALDKMGKPQIPGVIIEEITGTSSRS